jgi:hypothetical protein
MEVPLKINENVDARKENSLAQEEAPRQDDDFSPKVKSKEDKISRNEGGLDDEAFQVSHASICLV